MTRDYHQDGSVPMLGEVFVFGSNAAGLHLGGAAQAAFKYYGAEWKVSSGRMGQSYAIPTVNVAVSAPILLAQIAASVAEFLTYAEQSPDRFFITRIGCGIAGHRDADIAPLFRDAPPNCSLPDVWRPFFEPDPPPYPGNLIADCEALRVDAAAVAALNPGKILRDVMHDFATIFGDGKQERKDYELLQMGGYYNERR